MKKHIFHINLYKEQLKQLRLIGLIGLGLLSLFSILLPIGKALSMANERQNGYNLEKVAVGLLDSHFYLYFTFTLLVPILALVCFHYLTQRNSSDFYHSLPHTRTCMFTCNMAAITTWTTLILWVPTILSIIMYTIFNQYFILDIPSLLRFALFIYGACLLVITSIGIACSITGTVFTNVIVAGIIIFLPRTFILVFTEIITSSSQLLVSNRLFPLLDPQYNIIFGLLTPSGSASLTIGWSSFAYSILLALIYLALGLLAYKKRKSESSNQAAVSKKVQTVIRLILGFTVSLVPITLIFNVLTGYDRFESSDLPVFLYTMCILYLIACLVMLLYELITTKKFRNVLKALPSIGILAIINVVVLLGALGVYKVATNYSPDAEDIDYIITEPKLENGNTLYYDTRATSLRITDEKVLEMIANCLKENIESAKKDRWNSDDNQVIVGIHSGLTTHYRSLQMDMEDYKILTQSYSNSDGYMEAYQSLPSLTGDKLFLYNLSLSNREFLELYNIAKDEVASLKFNDWYLALKGQRNDVLDTIEFYATVNNESLPGIVPISGILPKTYMKYLEFYSKAMQGDKNTILTDLKKIQSKDTLDSYDWDMAYEILDLAQNLRLTYGNRNSNLYFEYSGQHIQAINEKVMERIISSTRDYKTFDPNKDYLVKVGYSKYNIQNYANSGGSYIFIVEKAELQDLVEAELSNFDPYTTYTE